MQPSVVMTLPLLMFTSDIMLLAVVPEIRFIGVRLLSVLFMPFGMDMSFPAATLILSNSVPKEQQGGGKLSEIWLIMRSHWE